MVLLSGGRYFAIELLGRNSGVSGSSVGTTAFGVIGSGLATTAFGVIRSGLGTGAFGVLVFG